MAMLNIDPTADDGYSAEIIRLARERSPAIDAWFVEQRFLNEAVDDSLTPMWFRNRMTIMLGEELKEMGIVINKDLDEACDEPQLVYAISMLRAKFDEYKLAELLKKQRALFEEIYADLDEDSFLRIIDWCNDNLPLDEGWQLLQDTLNEFPGIFSCDENFVERLQMICDKIDMLGEPDVETEADPELVAKYIRFLGKRQQYILEFAKKLLVRPGDTEFIAKTRSDGLERLVNGGFEKELGLKRVIADHIDEFSQVNLEDPEAISKFLNSIRSEFKSRWLHCPEAYFDDNETECTEKLQVVMFATMIVDAPHRSMYKVDVVDKLMSYEEHLGSDTVKLLVDQFNSYSKNMVDTVEIDYHEAE